MEHLSQEEIVMHCFGDSAQPAAAQAHLDACAECGAEFQKYSQLLAKVNGQVPERTEEYSGAVWNKLSPVLPQDYYPRSGWRALFSPTFSPMFTPQRAAFAAAALFALVMAFYVGRVSRPEVPPPTAEEKEQGRDRVALYAVSDHLERSQNALTELLNAEPDASGKVDVSAEQQQVRDLLAANRLYKQSAAKVSGRAVGDFLDDLERVLVEVSNGPSQLSEKDLVQIRQEIQGQGLLLKLRVLKSKVKNETKAAPHKQPSQGAQKL